MTTQNHPEIDPEIRPGTSHDFTRRARPAPGPVDFTVMYAAHDAFYRDLIQLTQAARSGRTAHPAVQARWITFKNQLHLHHTAEDVALWPALRRQVSDPAQVAVLDAMEAEHARIDPLLAQVDAALAGAGGAAAAVAASVAALADTLTGHMAHEEDEALPLVAAYLGAKGWAAFGRQAGRAQGLRGAAEFFGWMLDGASADTTRRLLGQLPPPVRLLYRAFWRPAYARRPRWTDAAS
jgi:Hemerythrin HHE cation binding domain